MPAAAAAPAHHPSDERLLAYAAGTLPEPPALLIATHLALCPGCRREVAELEALAGVLLETAPPAPLAAGGLERTLARLDEAPVAPPPPATASGGDRTLPQPLRDYVGDALDCLPWRRLGPLAELRLLAGCAGFTTRLLWVRAGTAVPAHTHAGSELTLVLQGGFTDRSAHFVRGDVEEADSTTEHRPVADRDDDCICLTVTDGPLKLTGRFGRLLNPFLRV